RRRADRTCTGRVCAGPRWPRCSERSRRNSLLDLLAGASCRFNVLACRFREFVGVHGQLLGEFAVSEDFDTGFLTLDEARLAQRALIDGRAVIESLEIGDVHDREFFFEDIREAALGKTTMQRHLPAFKSAHPGKAGARLLTFLAAPRRLSVTRPRSSADAFAGVSGAFFRF